MYINWILIGYNSKFYTGKNIIKPQHFGVKMWDVKPPSHHETKCKTSFLHKIATINIYSRSKKNIKNPIYFSTNYRTEIKLVPIIMDYCLLQFDVLKFVLGVRLHGVYVTNFNFFNVKP